MFFHLFFSIRKNLIKKFLKIKKLFSSFQKWKINIIHFYKLFFSLHLQVLKAHFFSKKNYILFSIYLKLLFFLFPKISHQSIPTAQGRINLGADPDQATGHRVLEVVLLREQRHNPRVDWATLDFAVRTLAHNAGADLKKI